MALLVFGDLLWCAVCHNGATPVAAFRTKVDDAIGRLDDVEVVLDDEYGVAGVHQTLEYLEQLARPLVQAGLLRSVRGKGGGYALAREASAVRAGDVLRAVEGTTAPVACLDLEDGMACPRANECTTVRFWAGLDDVIERYVDGVTLADLAGS